MFAWMTAALTAWGAVSARGSSYSCTGMAYGLEDSSMEVQIGSKIHEADRAVWTPMHRDYMPFFIRFAFAVDSGRLGGLKEVRAEVESTESFAKSYALLHTDTTRSPAPDSAWRVEFPASQNEPLSPGSQTPIWRSSAVIASAKVGHRATASTDRRRIAVLWASSDLNFEYFDGTGNMVGHAGSYSLSNPFEPLVGMRASLFPIAYARAMHGLQEGCAPADAMCECSNG
jgi:hypothetical protein